MGVVKEYVKEEMMFYSGDTWDVVRALDSTLPTSCKTPATSIDSISQPKQSSKKKQNPEKR